PGFSFGRRMGWFLTLAPVPRRAGAVGRAEPLRHNAFEAKPTSMAKHHVTRRHDVVVDLQPYRRLGEQPDQQHPATLEWLVPQVITIKLNEVERVEEHAPVIAPVAPPVEHRQAVLVAGDGPPADHAPAR